MTNRRGKSGNSGRVYFPGLQNHCDMKLRHLLLGRKAMTNLDSLIKSRDITLPTKVHIVKAIIFPVVMYRCESWTIKKAESSYVCTAQCTHLFNKPDYGSRRSCYVRISDSVSKLTVTGISTVGNP